MRTRFVLSSLPVLALVVACSSGGGGATSSSSSSGGSGSGGGGAGDFTASLESAPASGAKTVIVWTVSATSPDYSYVFGGGTTEGSSVFITFGGPPPAEALNGGTLGVGIVAVLADGVTLPEGKVDHDTDLDSAVVAASADHAVVYRADTEPATKGGWDASFPQGYACGKCVRADSGFDGFAVEDCSTVKVVPLSSDPDFCNWT